MKLGVGFRETLEGESTIKAMEQHRFKVMEKGHLQVMSDFCENKMSNQNISSTKSASEQPKPIRRDTNDLDNIF